MSPFEFDQLMILAGALEIKGDTRTPEVRAAYRDAALQLRHHLRHLDTLPPPSTPPPESDAER